nr:hypothetical protein [Tanacetum cinerariifolium]
MSKEERLVADIKKAIKDNKLATGPRQTTGSSEGAGLKLEDLNEPTVGTGAHDESEENDDKEDDNDDDQSIDLKEIDDEENKHDNDETQRDEYVHRDEYICTDDDERTKSDSKDQAMDDAKKNDEDKAEEEKDTNKNLFKMNKLKMRLRVEEKKKASKDAKLPKKPKSTGYSNDTTRSQPKLISKSIQLEETIFEAANTEMSLNQGNDTGNADEQPDVEAALK